MTITSPAPCVTAARRVAVRLTVLDVARPAAACDVVVEAPAGTTLGAVRAALADRTGLAADRPLACDGAALDRDAVLGLPPLLDGATLVGGGRAQAAPPALLEVHMVAGPDAGRRVPLAPGRWVLGRGPDAAVRVDDGDVSREHARLDVTADGVAVTDLGSTNGTAFAPPGGAAQDPLVPGEATGWPDGVLLVVGGSALALRPPDIAPAAVVPDGAGRLLVNRAPRLDPRPQRPVVRFPEPPPAARTVRLPWPALVLPALLAVPTALWWHQPSFLLLALLTPLALVGQHLVDRRAARRESRAAGAGHATATQQAQEALAAAVADDARRRERAHPDLGTLLGLAAGPGRRLWERSAKDDDALVVRVGTGPWPADVTVEGATAVVHDRGPVTLDLATARVAGLSGPGAAGLARAVVAQVVTLLPPQGVRVSVLAAAGRAERWDWVRWLPHAQDADDDRPVTLVVLDGAAELRRDPAVAALLAGAARPPQDPLDRTPRRRTVALCLDDDPALLPAECRATVTPSPPGTHDGLTATLRTQGAEHPCASDGLSAASAARLARDLARLRDSTPAAGAAGLPATVGLAGLAGLPADPSCWADAVGRRWAGTGGGPPALRVALGAAADGPWTVDLRRDGPHALVAGTTGAGKSELLRSLVAALALAHPPSQVSFLLVDYKGGTAFAGLEGLPHVAGLVTDLDRHTARRALTSLRAELRRREQVLRAVAAADLDAYDAARADGAPRAPLPRLVVVVDEFRALAEELPELVDGLLRVAALGRSLGVHLVLATQRPGGVVSADMRANLNLRIALRVRERADSDDVVEAPDAAAVPASRPGRAVVRTGGGALVAVQTALLGAAPDAGADAGIVVRRLDGRGAATATPTVPQGDVTPALVAAVRDAWGRRGGPPVRSPWLPPLPLVLLRNDVGTAATTGDPPRLVLGLSDLPAEQRREPLVWDLAAGHLAVVGGPGSGRSTTLRTVAAEALARGDVHVHVLTGAGDWFRAGAPDAATLGTVVPASDPDRTVRLLRRLVRERDAGWTLLVVDGWESVVEALAAHDRGRPYDDLLALARDHAGDGVRLAAAGGRALLGGTAGALLATRLLLRTADPADLLVAGVDPRDVPEAMPPGRAVLVGTAADGSRRVVESQVALLAADPRPAAQEAALAASAARRRPDGTAPPVRLRQLPTSVHLSDLKAAGVAEGALGPVRGVRVPAVGDEADPVPPAGVLVGIGGDEAVPVALPLPTGEVVLVAGPPGSGRTTALATIAAAATAAGRAVSHDAGKAAPGSVVVVDDVEHLLPDRLDRLEALVATGATAVVATTAAEAAVAFRGPLVAARRSRCGLLLGTLGPGEADVLGVREALPRATTPGRGVLVVRGAAVPVQVALPPAAGQDAPRGGPAGSMRQ